MKRHRWEKIGDHFYPVRSWRCKDCGLWKTTEYDAPNLYKEKVEAGAGCGPARTWHRYAPPCPPGEADDPEQTFKAGLRARIAKRGRG